MRNLTEGNLTKNFLLFSTPAILTSILDQSYAVINTAVVGKSLGDAGLAAIGATSSLVYVLSSVIWGIGLGVSIYIAALFGAADYKKMANAIKTNIFIIFSFSLLISLLTIAFRAPLFSLLKIGSDICLLLPRQIVSLFYNNAYSESGDLVVRYILICIPFIVAQLVNNLFHNFHRGVMAPEFAFAVTLVYSTVRIAATLLLVGKFKIDGVYLGFIIAWLSELAVSTCLYFSGKRKNRYFKTAEKIGVEN